MHFAVLLHNFASYLRNHILLICRQNKLKTLLKQNYEDYEKVKSQN